MKDEMSKRWQRVCRKIVEIEEDLTFKTETEVLKIVNTNINYRLPDGKVVEVTPVSY